MIESQETEPIRKPRQRNWLKAAVVACVVQGSWAAYANHDFGLRAALRATAAQAVYSFLGAAIMTLLMEWFFSVPKARGARFAASTLGSMSILLTVLVTVHWINGTPNLLLTMVPSLVILVIYSTLYSASLLRKWNSSSSDGASVAHRAES